MFLHNSKPGVVYKLSLQELGLSEAQWQLKKSLEVANVQVECFYKIVYSFEVGNTNED